MSSLSSANSCDSKKCGRGMQCIVKVNSIISRNLIFPETTFQAGHLLRRWCGLQTSTYVCQISHGDFPLIILSVAKWLIQCGVNEEYRECNGEGEQSVETCKNEYPVRICFSLSLQQYCQTLLNDDLNSVLSWVRNWWMCLQGWIHSTPRKVYQERTVPWSR